RQTNLDTLVKYGDSAFGTNLLRILTALHKDARTNEAANVSTLVSGCMATFNPMLEIAGRKLSRKFSTLSASHRFGVRADSEPLKVLKEDSQQYGDGVGQLDLSSEPLLAKIVQAHREIFDHTNRVETDMDYLLQAERKAAVHRDIHSVGIHLISGGTKIVRGVMVNYAWYHYPQRTAKSSSSSSSKSTSAKTSSSASPLATEIKNMQTANASAHKARSTYHQNQIMAASALIYVCGKAVQCLDIYRTDAIEIFKHRQLKAKRSVYGTILTGRINALDEMSDESRFLNHISTGAK
ncbi:MAG TPA: hypothetical protein V6C72_16640, partial [Chroococcales cyanobacterium]